MNKKFRKIAVVGMSCLTLGGFVAPVVSNTVYAESLKSFNKIDVDVSEYVDNYNFKYISKLTPTEFAKYKNALKISLSQHKNTDKEKVIFLVEKMVAKENDMIFIESRFFDWQGITVDQMGAAIDTAIAVATGGTAAFLANSVKHAGKHAIKSTLRSVISKFFGNWFVNDVAIDFMLNLASPGTWLATEWDKNDKVPNNGRINF